ncbi:unnamed protein product [Caenorhabditis nigoni]|uniref:Homeobox domain-containing protein n=1 Tax=Caenorhabditis nigoni TaxID=1611254 RepID=A0A2G5SKD6_9PELO|nr:hypothetical protein B9Z55_022456 [Caenorhabditis nigoni]
MLSNQIDLSAADVSQVLNFYQQERQTEVANAFSVKFLGNRKIHMHLLAFIPNPMEQNHFADVLRVSGTATMENGVIREFLSFDGTVTMKNTAGLTSNNTDEDMKSEGRESVEFLGTYSKDKETPLEDDKVSTASVQPENVEHLLNEQEHPEASSGSLISTLGTFPQSEVTSVVDDPVSNAAPVPVDSENLMDEMEQPEETNYAPFVSDIETFPQDEVIHVEEDQVSTVFVKPENCEYSLNEQERSETTSDSFISNLETCSHDKSESLEDDQVLNVSVEPVKCEQLLDEAEQQVPTCESFIPNLNSPQSLHLPPKFSNSPSPGFKSSNPPSEHSNEKLVSEESLKVKDVCGLLPEPTNSSSDAEDHLTTQPEDLHPQLTSQNRGIRLHPMSYMNFMNEVNQKNGQFNGLNLINLPQHLQSLLYSNNNVINNFSPIEKQNQTSTPVIKKPIHHSPPKSHPVASCPKPSGPLSKKPRRQRTTFTSEQLDSFEILFAKNPYPSFEKKEYLAQIYSLAPERISIWFKNRRAKQKSINNQLGEGPQSSIAREIKLEIPDEEYEVQSTAATLSIPNQSAPHQLLTNPRNQTDAIKLGSFPYIGTPTPQISFFGNRLQMIKPHQPFGTPKPTSSILNPLNNSYYVK